MMKKFAILLFFCNAFSFYGQLDSASIKKVDALLEDFYNEEYRNPSLAYKILDSAEALANRINYLMGQTSVSRQRAMYYSERGENEKSMAMLFQALRKDEKINNTDGAAMDLLYIGLNYFDQEKLNDALTYLKQAHQKYFEIHDEAGIALIESNIGMVYRNLNEYDTALIYYFRVKEYDKKMNKEKNLAHVLNNIGNIYKDQKHYDKAIENFMISKEISSRFNDEFYLVATLSNIADVYVEKKEFQKALDFYEQALKMAKNQQSLGLQKDVYFDLSYAYEKMNDFKNAYDYFKLSTQLRDSIISEKYNNDLAEMKVKYESEKKEGENSILKKDKKLQEVKIQEERKQKFLYAFLLGIVFFSCAIVFVQYRNKRKLNIQLAFINDKMNNQNITLRTLNRDLIESEENLTKANETKDQLIGMLSHDLYNPVTSVVNYTSEIIDKSGELSKEELILSVKKINNGIIPLQDLLDNTLQWARIQKKNMEPHIEHTDLQKILSDVVELYRPVATFKKIKISVTSEGNTSIKTDRLMMNFIIRNLVNNAVKFCATGKQVSINTVRINDSLTISVRDEGKGFPLEILEKLNNKTSNETIQAEGNGIGLSVSRQFIKLLKGNIEFRNRNGGAEVIITIDQV